MKRTWIAAAAMSVALAHAGPPVDLGKAGALDAIEANDPGLYAKIVDIMRIAGEVSCETLPQVLKVQYDVSRADCQGSMILTSYPAKRHLLFGFGDGTTYTVNVVLGGKPATPQKVVPPSSRGYMVPLTPP